MKINWLILLCVALIQPFMLHSAETAGISAASSGALTTIAQAPLNEEQITALATNLHAHAKNDLGLDVDHNAPYLIHRIKLFLSFRAHQHKDICQEASTFCYINQLNYTTENLGPKFTELQTDYGAPSPSPHLLFEYLLTQPTQSAISEITIAYDFSVLLCQYWQTISASLDRAQINIDPSSSLTTLAKKPLTQNQITNLAQQAIANCITPQTRKYETALQRKLAALLAFRSEVQSEKLRKQRIILIIRLQHLDHGNIQTNKHADTAASSFACSEKSWRSFFRDKLLTETADEQAEVTWAHETASLLIQYWPTYTAYEAQKYRKRIESLMATMANDVTTDARPTTTIAKAPLTQNRITILAQQAIALCITPQTRKYKATLQRKLAALLTFRSEVQSKDLRSKSARLIIEQQNLNIEYIQAHPHADINSSSSTSNTQSWKIFLESMMLTESTDEQEEIFWAHKIASLLVQYWPMHNAYMTQKKREYDAQKRTKAADSIEETQELLHKNRRLNDSPIPFVPVADEQISVSTPFDLLMDSNNSALNTALFPVDSNSFYFDPSTSIIEDYFQIGEHDEN